ncbi:MAG: chemotaxis protein CheW [Actinobacteria bacterium]|nr:chemotaxis protein CheW [Actinomycetota bacterium]
MSPSTIRPGDDDRVERVLAERARLLARPLEEPGIKGEEVVVLEGGGERYAVGLTWVERIHPVDAVTPLPGLRPPWRGLIALRGELLPALDLPSYLGRAPATDAGRAVGCAVVAHGGLRVAFLSEAPVTLMLCPEGCLSPPVVPTAAPPGAVVGVTDDLVTVIHVPTILADAALVVDD